MKTRLELAHDYLRDIISNWDFDDSFDPVAQAYEYADAMLAENEKRKYKTTLTTLQQTFINGVEQPRYTPCVEEWQPDWGLAPKGFNWFVKQYDGSTHFLMVKPELHNDWFATGVDGQWHEVEIDCPIEWRDSLRKRPEGK